MTANPGVTPGAGESSPLSNGANDYFSDGEGGAKSPVDLPLRFPVVDCGVTHRDTS
jgi:hypothetical protein